MEFYTALAIVTPARFLYLQHLIIRRLVRTSYKSTAIELHEGDQKVRKSCSPVQPLTASSSLSSRYF